MLLHRSRLPVIALGIALVVLGCQEDGDRRPVVSLDQARQTTARFEGKAFTAPPRSIADVTAVLDQLRPQTEHLATWRAAADAQPPGDLMASEAAGQLAWFYLNRSDAAAEVGRIEQSRADAARATALASQARIDLKEFKTRQGLIEMYAGRPRAALAHIEEWQNLSQGIGLVGPLANRGAMHMALGEVDQASARLTDARRISLSGQPVWINNATSHIMRLESVIARTTGRYEEALTSARAALRTIETGVYPFEQSLVASGQAVPYDFTNKRDGARALVAVPLTALGRGAEAEILLRAALSSQLQIRGRYHPWAALMVEHLSQAVLSQGRFEDAEKLAAANIDTLDRLEMDPTSTQFLGTRTTLLSALALRDRWADAQAQVRALQEATASDARLRRRFVEDNADVAASRLRAGDAAAVARELDDAIVRAERTYGRRHYLTAEMRGYLALARMQNGDRAAAATAFREAVPVLLSPSRESAETTGPVRERRRREILEGYLATLADLGSTAGAEAFVIAEAARGGTVQLAIGDAGARAAVRDPGLADLTRREQDARHRIGALNATLAGAVATGEQDAAAIARLRGEIDALRAARAALREEIERRHPDYARLVDPRPATVEQVQSALRDGEALIATYTIRDRTLVWAIGKTGTPAFANVRMGHADLERRVRGLRQALDPNARTLGDIPAFDVSASYELHRLLLEPVAGGWRGAKRLLVVPHGALAQLPLSVLVTRPSRLRAESGIEALFAPYRDVAFLAREAGVVQIPSAAAFLGLRSLPPGSNGRRPFIAFADPAFSSDPQLASAPAAAVENRDVVTRSLELKRRNVPQTRSANSAALAQLPALADTRDEVRAIAIALKADPVTDVFVGPAASERQVRAMKLDDRRVVMFATHGLVAGDLDGLNEPALALSAPQPGDSDNDGLLTMGEILALRLDADWVVLSACNTAAADGAGAEAISGLGRAFFYAGARALLVSNWPVETTSARVLTTDLFRRQAEDPSLERAEALQLAMLRLIDGPGPTDSAGRIVFSYAHPIFWAPFALVGDGGGRAGAAIAGSGAGPADWRPR